MRLFSFISLCFCLISSNLFLFFFFFRGEHKVKKWIKKIPFEIDADSVNWFHQNRTNCCAFCQPRKMRTIIIRWPASWSGFPVWFVYKQQSYITNNKIIEIYIKASSIISIIIIIIIICFKKIPDERFVV